MTPQEYVEKRLDEQIRWYDRKAIWNQKAYKRLRLTELIVSAAIPVVVGYIPDNPCLVNVVGVMGALVAVIAGALSLYKFHENWIEYRRVCETLKHEKYLYSTRVGVYNTGDPFRTLVERVEQIISSENSEWVRLHKQHN